MSSKKTRQPGWLWRWHYLVTAFVLFFGLGMLAAALQFSDVRHYQANATAADNMMGWLWADPIGWISLNNTNAGACSGTCSGSYGVTVDLATREITGFAWSDSTGWICFGSSCAAHADCTGTPPAGSLNAYINSGSGVVNLTGWAKVCNEGDKGWISLNCSDAGACGVYNYKVVYNAPNKTFNGVVGHPVPNTTSLAWNGNSDKTGFGYIDFEYATLNTPAENPPETNCKDGVDNDMNGLVDCADSACQASATCNQSNWGNTDYLGNPICRNGKNDDGTGIDCASSRCKGSTQCAENSTNTSFTGVNLCADSIDDDGDGATDCSDSGCSGYFACGTGEPTYGPTACHNSTDDDANGLADCADLNCQTFDPTCTPAWLSAKFGNVYAQKGITGSTTKSSTATYCLSSNGAISGFVSGTGCSEPTGGALSLPKGSTPSAVYKGTLGSLDIPGILAGRYGKVKELAIGSGDITSQVDQQLNGQVFHVVGNAKLSARVFQNGTMATMRGNGLLIVEGNLQITGSGTVLDYQALSSVNYLRNLASFGVIVKKDSAGAGGNINIDPTVTKIVGAYFAENNINTGTAGATDVRLDVIGLLAAHQINLQRNYSSPTQAAETVTFDGRAVANPPPGMADISKSLPTSKDAF